MTPQRRSDRLAALDARHEDTADRLDALELARPADVAPIAGDLL